VADDIRRWSQEESCGESGSLIIKQLVAYTARRKMVLHTSEIFRGLTIRLTEKGH